jgi:hypothetical protein
MNKIHQNILIIDILDKQSDIWCLGLLLFAFLNKDTLVPFRLTNQNSKNLADALKRKDK